MTTATTIDEAVADVAADTAKSKPIASDFYHGVSLGVFPKTIKRDDGTEFTLYSSKIEVRYKKDGEYFIADFTRLQQYVLKRLKSTIEIID